MSTKKLSRTLHETDRLTHQKFAKKISYKKFRSETKKWIKELDEDYESNKVCPNLMKAEKKLTERLTPFFRWIESNCNKKWDSVYSRLCTIFSKQNKFSDHIIKAHVLNEIVVQGFNQDFHVKTFYVDEKGFLKKNTQERKVSLIKFRKETLRKTRRWLGISSPSKSGNLLVWANPSCLNVYSKKIKRCSDCGGINSKYVNIQLKYFKIERAMTSHEAFHFNRLNKSFATEK